MIKVVLQGLGPIGIETAKKVLKDKKIEIVGAIDINPKIVGKDLGELLGVENLGVKVSDDAEEVLKKTDPNVLILATKSEFDEVERDIYRAVGDRTNVISPCEKLFNLKGDKADRLHETAKYWHVSVFEYGVNPGWVMDRKAYRVLRGRYTPSTDLAVVRRYDDITERRDSLWGKLCVNSKVDYFDMLNQQSKVGHVGLVPSGEYLADKLGITGYEIKFRREPVIAQENLYLRDTEIEKGRVIGIHETCIILVKDLHKIILDFQMSIGVENRNSVELNCKELINYKLPNGDIATAELLAKGVHEVFDGLPGLNTLDL